MPSHRGAKILGKRNRGIDMIDIHCHILHGVDDGSGNLSDSLEMAKLAADSGTKAIIATPHCNIPATFDNYWGKDIETKFSALRQAVKECGIPVEIYKGQEVFLSKMPIAPFCGCVVYYDKLR